MRVAILVVSILGGIVSLGLGACSLVCAGCQGSCASAMGGVPGPTHGPPGGAPGGPMHSPSVTPKDFSEAMEMLAYSNLAASIGQILQAVLILVGGIIAFVQLGRGEKAKLPAILMSVGVGLAVMAFALGLIILAQIDNSVMGNNADQFTSFIVVALMSLLMPVVSTGLTFFAKPPQPELATPQPQQYQQPPNDPGQQPPPA